MLYMDIKRVLNLRGIVKHFSYLHANGFLRGTATNYSNNNLWQIKFSLLEKLCLVLNCTPNDLFCWKPDSNQSVTENTALKVLIRNETESAISQIVKDLPIEKLEKAKILLAQLKDEE